jgi:hypothetical protein
MAWSFHGKPWFFAVILKVVLTQARDILDFVDPLIGTAGPGMRCDLATDVPLTHR